MNYRKEYHQKENPKISTIIFLYTLIKLFSIPIDISKFGQNKITADNINRAKHDLNIPLFSMKSNIFSSINPHLSIIMCNSLLSFQKLSFMKS